MEEYEGKRASFFGIKHIIEEKTQKYCICKFKDKQQIIYAWNTYENSLRHILDDGNEF